jgi:hypothetical protein
VKSLVIKIGLVISCRNQEDIAPALKNVDGHKTKGPPSIFESSLSRRYLLLDGEDGPGALRVQFSCSGALFSIISAIFLNANYSKSGTLISSASWAVNISTPQARKALIKARLMISSSR